MQSMNRDFWRQTDFFNPEKTPVSATVIGVGGIGSFTALALGKLGIKSLVLVDPDVVEAHNVPNQLFRMNDVEEAKVVAAARLIKELTGIEEIKTWVMRFPPKDNPYPKDLITTDLVVCGVDTMQGRKEIWESGIRRNPGVKLFIDGRLGGQQLRILSVKDTVSTESIERYEQTIVPDETVPDLPCTARAIIDVGFLIASYITRIVRRHFTGQPIPFETVADVSFQLQDQLFEWE